MKIYELEKPALNMQQADLSHFLVPQFFPSGHNLGFLRGRSLTVEALASQIGLPITMEVVL